MAVPPKAIEYIILFTCRAPKGAVELWLNLDKKSHFDYAFYANQCAVTWIWIEPQFSVIGYVIYIFMLTPKQKQALIKKFRTHDNDTGSPQVQIAILTKEVDLLTGHLRTHKKDYSSRRGLLKKVSERRKLLKYLEREDTSAWKKLKEDLKLK